MTICDSCGSELPTNARFCGRCGSGSVSRRAEPQQRTDIPAPPPPPPPQLFQIEQPEDRQKRADEVMPLPIQGFPNSPASGVASYQNPPAAPDHFAVSPSQAPHLQNPFIHGSHHQPTPAHGPHVQPVSPHGPHVQPAHIHGVHAQPVHTYGPHAQPISPHGTHAQPVHAQGVQTHLARGTLKQGGRFLSRRAVIVGTSGAAVAVAGGAVAAVLLSQNKAQGCGGALSDDFNGGLGSQWQWINPNGKASHSVANGVLTMSCPTHSDLFSGTNYDAPRLLQPVSGDFTMETLVILPTNYLSWYQGAGLLVWQDQDNFLRLERGTGGLIFDRQVKGAFSNIVIRHSTALRVELRLQRQKDRFTASWREGGQDWQSVGETTIAFSKIMVGLDLIAEYGTPPTSASYDYLHFTC